MKVKAEIIAVGTELLLGQISNTNAQWLSERLAEHGVDVYYHSVVGDNLQRVTDVFKLAEKRSDLIIVTGGLGPTEDDLTRDAASSVVNRALYEDKPSLERIAAYFEKNNRTMTPNNRKQALVFEGADVLQNHEGMAPGMVLSHKNKTWVFLPGVPREMKYLMEFEVLPILLKQFELDETIVSRMLRFIGIGEAQLEDTLKDIIDSQTNPTVAPLATEGEVAIRLSAKATSKEEAYKCFQTVESKIYDRVGDYIYGYDTDTIAEVVLNLLKEKGMTIAAAESLTGGMFANELVSLSGASEVVKGSIVSYATSVKENTLNVPKNILNKFGTVSEKCAQTMAVNAQTIMDANVGISFTGVAGPNSVEGKPLGLVYIGIQIGNKESVTHRFQFSGSRQTIRTRAVKKGLELLYHQLKNSF